jgi:hypothetical protein
MVQFQIENLNFRQLRSAFVTKEHNDPTAIMDSKSKIKLSATKSTIGWVHILACRRPNNCKACFHPSITVLPLIVNQTTKFEL